MSRYETAFMRDEPFIPEGDKGFTGVDARQDPRLLDPGLVSEAVNKRFLHGTAEDRLGFQTARWAGEWYLTFPITFGEDEQQLDELLGETIDSLVGLNWRIYNGTTFQVRRRNGNDFYAIWIEDVGGVPTFALDPTPMDLQEWVHATLDPDNANFRLLDGDTFQLLNVTTGNWHSVWVELVGSIPTLALDPVGMAPGDPASAVVEPNWRTRDAKVFQLVNPETTRWYTLQVVVNGGVPSLGLDSGGDRDGGVDFDQAGGFGTVFGVGEFSDPYGNEAVLLAVRGGVYRIQGNVEPAFLRLPDAEQITGPVRFVQAFDRVLMLRGADHEPLVWNPRAEFTRGYEAWEFISVSDGRVDDPDNDYGDGTRQIPNVDDGLAFNNRVYLIAERDEIVVSDVLDYTRYNETFQRWRINSGTDDRIVRIMPWNNTTLVVFKDQSIYLLGNVVGDLSEVRADVLTHEFGLLGRDLAAEVGRDIWFFSTGGLFSVNMALDNRLQANADPISGPILPIMRRIHWPSISGGQMIYHDNRLLVAVPIDGATWNNALLVFDFVAGQWAGVWTADFLDVFRFVRTNRMGRRVVWGVNGNRGDYQASGAMFEVGVGWEDDLYGTRTPIESRLVTRGYSHTVLDPKRFMQARVDVSTWAPEYQVRLLTEGVSESLNADVWTTLDRTKWMQWGRRAWDPTNVNDDHMAAYREDYSVFLTDGMFLGTGVNAQAQQRITETHRVRGRGSYSQIEVENRAGRHVLHGVLVGAVSGKRVHRKAV